MKRILLLVTGVFIAFNVFAQTPKDCKIFRTGTFKMIYMGKETTIVRTATKQSQYFEHTKIPIEFAVKWIDNCTFTLTPLIKKIKNHPEIPANAVLTMEIVKTSANSYTQITTANFTKQAITQEIYKVK
jgi:hypothetical protein